MMTLNEQNRRDFKGFLERSAMCPKAAAKAHNALNKSRNQRENRSNLISVQDSRVSLCVKEMDVCLLPQTTKNNRLGRSKIPVDWFGTQPHIITPLDRHHHHHFNRYTQDWKVCQATGKTAARRVAALIGLIIYFGVCAAVYAAFLSILQSAFSRLLSDSRSVLLELRTMSSPVKESPSKTAQYPNQSRGFFYGPKGFASIIFSV